MKKYLIKAALPFCFTIFMYSAYGQNGGVSINPNNTPAHPSAMFDVSSPTSPYMGMLIPRMTTASRNSIISPATGLQIFNIDCGINEYYTGTCWISLGQNLKSPGQITCSGTTDFCANDSRTFTIPSVSGATNYIWMVPAGATITAGQGSTTVTVIFGNNSGQVCVSTENACETSPARCMDIHIISPSLPAISSNSPICQGATLNLSATALPAVYTFSWTGPNGFSSNLQNPSIPNASPSATGSYSLSVIFSGCTSTPLLTTVTVYGTPSTPIAAASPNPICAGSTLNLTTSTVSGASYNWTGPNGFTSTIQNPSVSNIQASNAGTYNVTTMVNGCVSASGSVSVAVNSSVVSTFTPSTGTANSPVIFTPTTSGATYSWTFTSGSPPSSAAQNPSVTWSSAGTYSVSLTVTSNGCSSTTTNTITINALPTTVTFNATSSGSTGTIQTFTVPFTGVYTIEAFGASSVKAAWNVSNGFASVTAGSGARMKGDFNLSSGTVLNIVVGQQGSSNSQSSSGGGGTFVYTGTNTMLIVAGGGGGCGLRANGAGGNGVTTTDGTTQSGSTAAGTGGGGGGSSSTNYTGGGGAGYNGNGADATGQYPGKGGKTYSSSWTGGDNGYTSPGSGNGGFGGGGGAGAEGGGGGGGYSGGSGGIGCTNCNSGGGGGGSYNGGTNQSNSAGVQTGHGLVTITY